MENLSEDAVRMLALIGILNGEIKESELPDELKAVVNEFKTVYVVTKDSWNKNKQRLLASRTSFDSTLKEFISGKELGKIIFMLPSSVTTAERHRLHTFSRKGLNSCESDTYNDKRIMKIVLEATYRAHVNK